MAIKGVRHGLKSRGSYNIEVELNGNWVKFNELVNSSNLIMASAARSAQKKFAEKYRDRVKENIANHGIRFGYPSLNEKYVKRKAKAGGSMGALTWSMKMYRSVSIRANSDGTRWAVGIPKGLKRHKYDKSDKNSLQVHEYANIMEQGLPGQNVPARPVFSDTFRKGPSEGGVGGLKALKGFIEMALVLKFGAKGFIVTKM